MTCHKYFMHHITVIMHDRETNVRGKVALVTGANRGIGAALVEALVSAGAERVYAASRAGKPALSHEAVVPMSLDVTSEGDVARAAEIASDVQILINNAGVSSGASLLGAATLEDAAREMQVNYFGTLAMCRAFAPVLARNEGGAIVNVLSILSRVSLPPVGSYSASKAAAYSLTQSLRAELASQGTLVIGVMPGFVDTEMASRVPFPKLSPAALAASVIEALSTGTEDVYPGEASQVAELLRQDPKAVERRFATLFATQS
jgi:NAD(P)-dependent dehydrogenase (short-subunit alcohol dehydrogenase family)